MEEKELRERKKEILKQKKTLEKELSHINSELENYEDKSFKDFFLANYMYFFVFAFIISMLLIGFGIASFAKEQNKTNMLTITAGGVIFLVLFVCWPIVNHIANKRKEGK